MTASLYAPIIIFILIAFALGVIMMLAGALFSKHAPNSEKSSAYECGFAAFEDARLPFDVKFYLIAILFILFDLETAFFFPWALVLRKLGMFGFLAMMLFLLMLLIGFIYEWKQGALEWE